MFSVFDTLAVTSSVNSGCGRPEVVCHLLSSCVHASITSKSGSKVVNFNAYRNSAVPIFRLYNQELEERNYLTYLGMLFDKHMNLHHAATYALRPFNAALRSERVWY